MTTATASLALDPRGLERLRNQAGASPEKSIREASKQFEVLFVNMLDRERAGLATAQADLARVVAQFDQAVANEKRALKLQTTNPDYLSEQEMDQLKFTRIALVAPARKNASIEVRIGEEFIGTVHRDAEDGDVSYSISIVVLAEDLAQIN